MRKVVAISVATGLLLAAGSAAAAKLAKRIREGGVGVWGQMPMPAQSQVSDADAKTLVKYILSL